jgi:Fe-S cluster assembly ATP-binding protein
MLLSVQNLHANFQETPLLRGVNIEVNAGELHLILGLNGSGKSTFGKVLMNHPAYLKTQGEIIFSGENIDALETYERAQKGIFLSHQSPPAVEGVSAKDLLRAANKSGENTLSVLAFKKNLAENIKKSGLSRNFLTRSFNDGASGGERKKMEIASLLTLGAKLAFLDEIDSGLDVDALKAVSAGINNFLAEEGRGVILVSHSSGILQHVRPTHVHVFCGGRIIKTGGMELAEEIHKNGYAGVMNCGVCREKNEKI